MVFFLTNAEAQQTSDNAVATMFHFPDNFDILPGAGIPPASTSEKHADYTSWTTVSDLKKKQYRWKTCGNPGVRVIDTAQALTAAGNKMTTVEMGPQGKDIFTPSTMVEVK